MLEWLTVAGLGLDLFGASLLAWGAIVSPEEAADMARARLASKEHPERDQQMPLAAALLRQSRLTKKGLLLLVFGFLFQLIAAWPRS